MGLASNLFPKRAGKVTAARRFGNLRLVVAILVSLALHLVIAMAVRPEQYARPPYRVTLTALLTTTTVAPPDGTTSVLSHTSTEKKPSAPLSKSDTNAGGSIKTKPEGEASKAFQVPVAGYYPSSELTYPPEPLSSVDPPELDKYPGAGPGKMVLTLWISDTGTVIYALQESSTLPQDISSIVVEAFEQLKFKPGELNGKQVGALLKIEVDFH